MKWMLMSTKKEVLSVINELSYRFAGEIEQNFQNSFVTCCFFFAKIFEDKLGEESICFYLG